MKTKQLIPALLIGVSLGALAQNRPPGPPPDPIAMALDKDGDHELSKREIRNAADSLVKLDKDKDGALSEEELRPEPPEGERRRKKDDGNNANPPPPPPPSMLFSAVDADGDRSLSKEELEAAPEALLKLDVDDDEKLDNEEAPSLGDPEEGGFSPSPGGGGGRPPHPPGGGGGPPRR